MTSKTPEAQSRTIRSFTFDPPASAASPAGTHILTIERTYDARELQRARSEVPDADDRARAGRLTDDELAKLYADAAEEDRALANAGLEEYARGLALIDEDDQRSTTP